MSHLFAAGKLAPEFDRHRELIASTGRLARAKLDRRGLLMAEDHSLPETKIVDAANQ
jgi:hypothetical protein